MATERIQIVVTESGTRTATREIMKIGSVGAAAATQVGLLRTALVSLGGALALGNTVRTIANFEQAISTVRAVSQATEEQFQALKNTALELGATTRFTATQAAEGLEFLARAGFNADEQLASITDTLRLAQAGNIDLARAADISTNVLRGFRLEATEAGRAADVLARIATLTNTNISQLGDALKFVAPVAAGVGVSMEETSAAVGALSNAGLQSTIAGTGLRRIISELEAPTKKARDILASLGLTAKEVAVSQVGLTQALIKLSNAGVTTGQAIEIFGDRGGPAFEVLASSIPDIVRLTGELNNAGGTAERIATIMDDNLNGALLSVESAFEAVQLAIGNIGGSNLLIRVLDNVATSLRFVANNTEVLSGLLTALSLLVIPRLLTALNFLRRSLIATFSLSGLGFVTIVSTLVAFRKEILVTGDSVTTLGDLMNAVLERIGNAFTITVRAIGNLFGNEFFSNFSTSLQDVGILFETFVRAVAKGFDLILGSAVGIRRGIEASWRQLPVALLSVAIEIANGVIGKFEAMMNAVLAIFTTIGETAAQIGIGVAQSLENLARSARLALIGETAAAAEVAANAVTILQTRLEIAFTDLPGRLGRTFTRLSQDELLPRFTNIAEQGGKEFADNFSQGFNDGLAESNLISIGVDEIFTRAAEIGRDRVRTETEALGKELQSTPRVETDVPGLGDPEDRLDPRGVLAGFRSGFQKIREEVTDFATQAENTLVNAFQGAEDALVDFVTTGELNFSRLVDSILADLTRLLAQQAISGIFGSLFGGGGGGAGGFLGGIFGGLFGGARADGGPVEPGKAFLVGERGPELFVPNQSGSVMTADQVGASAPTPQVNVQVVNVSDPQEVPRALNTPEGERAILNIIRKNRRSINQELA